MGTIIIANSYDYTVTNTIGEHVDMPAAMLAAQQPRDIHQSTTADATLQIDLGQALAVDLIALLYTNATTAATWEIRAAATQGGLATGAVIKASSPFRNGTVIREDGRSHGLASLAAPPAYRWWQVKLLGGAVPGGLLQMGRLIIGRAFQPTWNMAWKADYRYIKTGSGTQLSSGAFIPAASEACRGFQVKLNHLTEDEAWTDYYALSERAVSRAVVMIPDMDHDYVQRQMIYGVLDVGQPTFRKMLNEYQTTINMREMV